MDKVLRFHAGSKNMVVFRRHFIEDGSLAKTRIASVINGQLSDNRIVYDGSTNDVYLDCTEDVLTVIANKTFETNVNYFLDSSELRQTGGNKLIDIQFSEDSKDSKDSDESQDMEKIFQNIDTVASPTNPNAKLYGGDHSEIDNLVNNIHDKLSNEHKNDMEDILQILKDGCKEGGGVKDTNALTAITTTELKTDIEQNGMIRSKYIDIN